MATQKSLIILFQELNFDEQQRHELVYAWTGGRTQSTKQLLSIEIDDLYLKLKKDFRFNSNTDAYVEIEMKKKRSTVLAIATRVGIHNTRNWNKFNNFMLNSSILKKQLNQYKIKELDTLIRQFKAIETNYNKSSKKIGTKAWTHKNNMPTLFQN